jgi:hypothetical protein
VAKPAAHPVAKAAPADAPTTAPVAAVVVPLLLSPRTAGGDCTAAHVAPPGAHPHADVVEAAAASAAPDPSGGAPPPPLPPLSPGVPLPAPPTSGSSCSSASASSGGGDRVGAGLPSAVVDFYGTAVPDAAVARYLPGSSEQVVRNAGDPPATPD